MKIPGNHCLEEPTSESILSRLMFPSLKILLPGSVVVYSGREYTGNYSYARSIAERDFESFNGPYLEKYFREKLALAGDYSLIGRYWEKGNQNEIDIVAVNEVEKRILFAEVKRNKAKISPALLKAKSSKLLNTFPGYMVTYSHLSMEDM